MTGAQPKRPRICLVTSATRGLGKAVALAYTRQAPAWCSWARRMTSASSRRRAQGWLRVQGRRRRPPHAARRPS